MSLLASFFLVLAGLGVWSWLCASPHEGRFQSQFPTVWVVLTGLLALLCYVPTLRADLAAARAGKAMSLLVGEKVSYTCGSAINTFFDRDTDFAAGYVRFDQDGRPDKTSKLRYDLCRGLVDFLADPNDLQGDSRMKIFAVHAITHEARHMLGERGEAAADCQAVQRNALTARALGANPAAARELALIYYQRYYPHHPYASSSCRQGGDLDENLPTSPWKLNSKVSFPDRS